jgi:hypothetical protein
LEDARLTESAQIQNGSHGRHWAVDAVLGSAAALAAVAVAHAALPDHIAPLVRHDKATPTVAAVAEVAPAPVAAPRPLLAFGEPVPGYSVDSPWGLRRLPWEAHGRLHEGVDIAAPMGAPIVAVADGIVARSGVSPSYGRFVELKHAGELTSFYAHLGGVDRGVRPGAFIRAGLPVAKVGNGGDSTGPHLHFEIRKHDEPLNPLVFLNRSFATAQALPLTLAAYVSPRVRVAYVSSIPESKQAAMDAMLGKPHGKTSKASARDLKSSNGLILAKAKDGRPRGTFFKVYDSDKDLPDPPSSASAQATEVIMPTG